MPSEDDFRLTLVVARISFSFDISTPSIGAGPAQADLGGQPEIWRVGPANQFAFMPRPAFAGATHDWVSSRLYEDETTDEAGDERDNQYQIPRTTGGESASCKPATEWRLSDSGHSPALPTTTATAPPAKFPAALRRCQRRPVRSWVSGDDAARCNCSAVRSGKTAPPTTPATTRRTVGLSPHEGCRELRDWLGGTSAILPLLPANPDLRQEL